ncbi:hypothetical protein [Streptomyces sp. NPDC001100]
MRGPRPCGRLVTGPVARTATDGDPRHIAHAPTAAAPPVERVRDLRDGLAWALGELAQPELRAPPSSGSDRRPALV